MDAKSMPFDEAQDMPFDEAQDMLREPQHERSGRHQIENQKNFRSPRRAAFLWRRLEGLSRRKSTVSQGGTAWT